MVKLYEKYAPTDAFGLIYSPTSNLIFSDDFDAIVPMGESLGVIQLKTGQSMVLEKPTEDELPVVTCILKIGPGKLAAGYSDGHVKVYSSNGRYHRYEHLIFHGHKTAVTALAYEPTKQLLASGSSDTEIVIWDVVAETGLYRLNGHKDAVTCLTFLDSEYLLSGSKDALLKIWDLTTRMCVETVIHRHPVYCFAKLNDSILTGGGDAIIRVFKVDMQILRDKMTSKENTVCCELLGTIERESKEKILAIKVHPNLHMFATHGSDRLIEFYRVLTPKEINKKTQKKKTKGKEFDFADAYPHAVTIRCSAKVKSFDLKEDWVLCGLANNAIELYQVDSSKKKPEPRLSSTIDSLGHRADIRTVCLSSDDDYILSASNDEAKIWSTRTNQCIQTMDCGYALCSAFLPGNRQIILGTKTGELELFDLGSSSLITSIQAHEGPIWSLCLYKGGIVTGSQDKKVKFWDLKQEDGLKLSHSKTLKMNDDVLCVKVSHDNKYLAVSLLDSTVKIFYFDSCKFLHSLYGHKLPVLSMDISSDGSIIATASSDKSIKIWGLDFGDCHKSFLAHSDSVMACQFVFGTHYLFSVSKDKTIKYWDADKFENIMTLRGHHGEVWCLAIAKYGKFLVSGSHDRSLRVWTKTSDAFALEEEREKELDKMYDVVPDDRYEAPIGSDGNHQVPESTRAVARTTESLKSGERLMEALDIFDRERQDLATFKSLLEKDPNAAPPPKHPLVGNLTAAQYVAQVISKIQPSHLQDSLLVLPFSHVILLFECCLELEPQQISFKWIHFLLQTHHYEIISTRSLRQTLDSLKLILQDKANRIRSTIGFNTAALKFLKADYEAEHSTIY